MTGHEARLQQWIEAIGQRDEAAMQAARQRQLSLTKPPESLGRLEEISIALAGIQARPIPQITGKAVLVFAADHGVAAEGVSAYPQEVTRQMVLNFLRGGAAINVLARHAGAQIIVVDMGVAGELPDADGLVKIHIRDGTSNIAAGPAMSRAEALRAMAEAGALAESLCSQDVNLLALGDMGIANTTAAAAVIAAITGWPVEEVAGHGTGVRADAFLNKIEVIKTALKRNDPDPSDPIDVLAKLGGFEIAGIAGAALAAAASRCAIVVDGVISAAGVLIAFELQRRLAQFLFAGHLSTEPGHRAALEWMGLRPILDLQMRLGEGTGAALAMLIIEAAAKILSDMATFDDAGVSGPVQG